MSFAVPSNSFRLEGASLRNSYAAGRDLTNSVTSLEVRVTDQQRQINELRTQLIQVTTEKNDLAARLTIVEGILLSLTLSSG